MRYANIKSLQLGFPASIPRNKNIANP